MVPNYPGFYLLHHPWTSLTDQVSATLPLASRNQCVCLTETCLPVGASCRQACIHPRPGGAVPLQPQPRISEPSNDLRWNSHSSERFVGHPLLAVGAVRDPARGDRARGALPGAHLRRGVP